MAAVNPRTEYRGIQWVPSARKSSTRFASASVPKAASSTRLIESWSSCEFSRSLRVLHKWPVRGMLSLLPSGQLRSRPGEPPTRIRSEEHTSELQSRGHLVCRLLLEKKKPLEIKSLSAGHRLYKFLSQPNTFCESSSSDSLYLCELLAPYAQRQNNTSTQRK